MLERWSLDDIGGGSERVTNVTTADIDPKPWGDKLNVAFFPGCPTGGRGLDINPEGTYINARLRLIKAAEAYNKERGTGAAYIGLSNLCQDLANINEAQSLRRVPFENFAAYKYIVNVDGNTYTSRLPSLLLTGSVIVDIGLNTDIVRRTLADGEHVVRVSLGMEDFASKLDWLVHNDDAALVIAKRGLEHYKTHFKRSNYMDYITALLLEYSASVHVIDADNAVTASVSAAVRNEKVAGIDQLCHMLGSSLCT
eukprot:jgi/Chlat1/5404/Chrsp35S08989